MSGRLLSGGGCNFPSDTPKVQSATLFSIFALFRTYGILTMQVIRNALVKKWFIKLIFLK